MKERRHCRSERSEGRSERERLQREVGESGTLKGGAHEVPGGGKPGETQQEGGGGNGYIGSHLRKADKARERGWQSAVFGTSVARPSRGGLVFPLLSPSHPLINSAASCPRSPAARERLSQQTAMQGRRVGGWRRVIPTRPGPGPRFQRPGSRSTRPTRRRGLPRPALAGGPLLYPCALVGPPLEPILTEPMGFKGPPTRLAPDHRSPFSARRWQGRQLRFIPWRCCTGGRRERERRTVCSPVDIARQQKKTHAMRALLSNINNLDAVWRQPCACGASWSKIPRGWPFCSASDSINPAPIGPSSDHAGFFA